MSGSADVRAVIPASVGWQALSVLEQLSLPLQRRRVAAALDRINGGAGRQQFSAEVTVHRQLLEAVAALKAALVGLPIETPEAIELVGDDADSQWGEALTATGQK